MMNPAWEEACEEYEENEESEENEENEENGDIGMLYTETSGPFSPGRTARSADSARSRRSSNSAHTSSSESTVASHLSETLAALGLGPLSEAGHKGHFSDAACYDGSGARKWPGPPPSESGADVKEGPDMRCADDDLGDNMDSVSACTCPAGGRHARQDPRRQMAGASKGKVRFSEPAPPAMHVAIIMSL
mmetsp:Transcript_80704/g.227096  ORF Transcript_80704/g.227096 Transcript_80704/m.227096 type:complete len:190 (-) Transcript_80704:80-649(-)